MRKLLVIAALASSLGACEKAQDSAEAPSPAASVTAGEADTVDAADAAVDAMIEDAEQRADTAQVPAAAE